MTSRKKI